MAQENSNDTGTAQSPRYESPAYDPRGAFAWTLRSGEIARREQNRLPESGEVVSIDPDTAGTVEKNTSHAPRCATPTFDPRGAFAWTLRSAEIARLERRRQLAGTELRAVLAVAA